MFDGIAPGPKIALSLCQLFSDLLCLTGLQPPLLARALAPWWDCQLFSYLLCLPELILSQNRLGRFCQLFSYLLCLSGLSKTPFGVRRVVNRFPCVPCCQRISPSVGIAPLQVQIHCCKCCQHLLVFADIAPATPIAAAMRSSSLPTGFPVCRYRTDQPARAKGHLELLPTGFPVCRYCTVVAGLTVHTQGRVANRFPCLPVLHPYTTKTTTNTLLSSSFASTSSPHVIFDKTPCILAARPTSSSSPWRSQRPQVVASIRRIPRTVITATPPGQSDSFSSNNFASTFSRFNVSELTYRSHKIP